MKARWLIGNCKSSVSGGFDSSTPIYSSGLNPVVLTQKLSLHGLIIVFCLQEVVFNALIEHSLRISRTACSLTVQCHPVSDSVLPWKIRFHWLIWNVQRSVPSGFNSIALVHSSGLNAVAVLRDVTPPPYNCGLARKKSSSMP